MIEPSRQVYVLADLDLEVDGQIIKVSGDGRDVVISASDLSGLARQIVVMAAALGTGVRASRRYLGQLANAANRTGIRVTVVGQSGTAVTVGRGVNVRLSSWLARSPHVRLHPGRESIAALVAVLRR